MGASDRHNEPGSQPASACPAQPPSTAGAPRHRESGPEHRERPDRRRRGASRGARKHAREARRRPQPRYTDRCQAATAAGCRKPGEQQTGARGQVPSNTSRRQDGRVRARQRTQPLPATEQPPSGWTRVRPEGNQPLPATNSHRPDGRVSAPQRGPTHATHSTTHRASTPVNRSQVAQDTAQHTGQAHR